LKESIILKVLLEFKVKTLQNLHGTGMKQFVKREFTDRVRDC